jgi:NADH-quinone oxidoreductase subunit J
VHELGAYKRQSASRSIAVAVLVSIALVLGMSSVAFAQQAAQPNASAETAPVSGDKITAGEDAKPDNKKLGNSRAMALLFWMFALMCVGGTIFVITRRNLISAVMGMVGTFFAVAAVYTMLFAHFIAIIQVLVYAGAIMVLFVFVIMILNRPEDEPWSATSARGMLGKLVGGAALLYLFVRIGQVLWSVEPDSPQAGLAPGNTIDGADFGSTRAVGHYLFDSYLFPFEAVSIVLLVAVVGAIAVARPYADPLPAHTPDTTEEGA